MKKIVVSIVVVFIATAFSISAMAESRYKLLRSKNLDRSVAKRTVYQGNRGTPMKICVSPWGSGHRNILIL